jgi:hypothetical protein
MGILRPTRPLTDGRTARCPDDSFHRGIRLALDGKRGADPFPSRSESSTSTRAWHDTTQRSVHQLFA